MDKQLKKVTDKYAVRLSQNIKDTIKLSNNTDSDPVAKQYLPSLAELKQTPGESTDPIGDEAHTPIKGIVHRYPDRVLLKPVNVCAVYCRYCFRREMIGPGQKALSKTELENAIEYIRNNDSIWEVILTGGDPLILSPKKLSSILKQLQDIKHVQIIRIHTRVPIADPQRITAEHIAALQSTKTIYIILHINHVNEINKPVITAITDLRKVNCTLLSQSVLLKDINDHPDILSILFRKLVSLHVKPYYLHHPDLAPGTSHFRVSIERGQTIMKELRGKLSGLCMPEYMLDIPGGYGKVPLTPCYIESLDNGEKSIEDHQGNKHIYPPNTEKARSA